MFRKPPPDKIKINTYELGLTALENAFEAMREEITSAIAKRTYRYLVMYTNIKNHYIARV